MSNIGNGYLGSPKLETSTENQELVPNTPENWSYGYKLKKFAIQNNTDCTIVINYDTEIFLQSGQGWQMDKDDEPIYSFIIKEAGVKYNWSATY